MEKSANEWMLEEKSIPLSPAIDVKVKLSEVDVR